MSCILQSKADTLRPSWTQSLESRVVGCFLLDTPMGGDGQQAWSLEELVGDIQIIHSTFTLPYSIIIYSLYSMGEVQRALQATNEAEGSTSKEGLQITKFVMVKVCMCAACTWFNLGCEYSCSQNPNLYVVSEVTGCSS